MAAAGDHRLRRRARQTSTRRSRSAARRAYIGWDIVCLGRTGIGRALRHAGELRTAARVRPRRQAAWIGARAHRAGRRRVARVAGGARRAAGLRDADRCGAATSRIDALRRCRASPAGARRRGRASRACPSVLVARYLRRLERSGARLFHALWAPAAAGAVGCAAAAPRIWAHLREDDDGTDTKGKGQAADLHRRAARRAAQGARAQAQLSRGGGLHHAPRSWKARATAAASPS